MTPTELLGQAIWTDASFERLEADYDGVRVTVRDATQRILNIKAIGHIACSWSGHWDESIIERVEVRDDDAAVGFAVRSVIERYGAHPTRGGGLRDLAGPWHLLRFHFLDGAMIDIVAQRFELEVQT